MELLIPKILPQHLDSKQYINYLELDNTPYGSELAQAVADRLVEEASNTSWGGLFFAHQYYCGLGLFYTQGQFVLGTVDDGYGLNITVARFDSEFSAWLASESDRSMACYGEYFNNQTITRLRLQWYLDEDYSHSWNAYCAYTRQRQNYDDHLLA
ncbi:MAG: hypothetical protein ACK5ME_08255 [Parahaliea sp.]